MWYNLVFIPYLSAIYYCSFYSLAMKNITVFTILFSSFVLHSKEKLEIYFNVDDCTNCNNLIRFTNNIETGIDKIFWLCGENKTVVNEIFQNFGVSPTDFEIKYLPNDFFQCKKSNCVTRVLSSYCVFIDRSEKKDSFSLKELPEKIKVLKRNNWNNQNHFYGLESSSDSIRSLAVNVSKLHGTLVLLPDSIKISKRTNVFIKDSTINIFDQRLNKNITLYLNSNFSRIKKIHQIKGNNLDVNSFVATNPFDTTFYRGLYPRFKSMGVHLPKIESVFINDTTINLMVNLTYGRYPDPKTTDSLRLKRKVKPLAINDTIADMKYFFYSENIRTNKFQVRYMDKMSYENSEYWALGLPFILVHDKLLASVHSYSKPNSEVLLAEFKVKNDRVEFTSTHINSTKNIRTNSLADKQIMFRDINSNFYFTASVPFFYDFKKNEDFLLDEKDFNSEDKLHILDVIRDKEKLLILVSEGDKIFKYTFNYSTKKKEEKMQLDLDLPAKEINIRFLETDKYLILDSDKLQILTH